MSQLSRTKGYGDMECEHRISGEALGYGVLATAMLGFFTYAFAANAEHWYAWIGIFFLAAFTLLIGSATAFQMWELLRSVPPR